MCTGLIKLQNGFSQKLEEGTRPVEMHHSQSESFCSRVPVGDFAGGSLCGLIESPRMD